MSKVLVIVGPTATGKSDLAIELAERYDGEIINGDSVSVYRELNIGSAKTPIDQQRGIVHHLLDYKDVTEEYDVATFQKDARKAIREIESRGKLPIVVGGTGLYIKALLYDYEFARMQQADLSSYEKLTDQQLYQLLQEKDPESAEKIHPNNRKRVLRALQIAESGTTKSLLESQQEHKPVYDNLIIGLTMDRSHLKERINIRVDRMMQMGLLEEVRELFEKYPSTLHCFNSIGYREFTEYFPGNRSLNETVEQIKVHTRQFAKRQYTWFRNQMDVCWFDIENPEYRKDIERKVEDFIHE